MDRVPLRNGRLREHGVPHGRVSDKRRVVLHDRKVVDGVQKDGLGGNFKRAAKRDDDVADGRRDRIAVDEDKALLRVHDEPKARVVGSGNPRHAVRDIECDRDARRLHGFGRLAIAQAAKRGRRRLDRARRRRLRQAHALPQTSLAVQRASRHGVPATVDRNDRCLFPVAIAEGDVAQSHALLVREDDHRALESVERRRLRSVHRQNDAILRHERAREHVPGVRDADAAHGHRRVARDRVRQRMEDAAAHLEVARRHDAVKVLHGDPRCNGLAAALDIHDNLLANGVVQHPLEYHERVDALVLHAHEHVAGLQRTVARALGNGLVDDEKSRGKGIVEAERGLRARAHAKPPHFVVGKIAEDRLESAARDRHALLDEVKRTHDTVQREIEGRRRLPLATGVDGDGKSVNVHDGRPA
eukprot:Opistho-1_new@24079